MNINIREMKDEDLGSVANVHKRSFIRQKESLQWIECNFKAHPRIMIFVATLDSDIIGYIQWIQKSGFRSECVIELEQLAVLEEYRNQGVGKELINKSLQIIKHQLETNNSILKNIIVTTRNDNHAKKIYEETLNAKEEHIIKLLYSGDESILIAKV